jgi:predicted PurR-regulated permease PerM
MDEDVSTDEKRGMRTTSIVIVAVVASCAAFYFGRALFVPVVFAVVLNALFRPVVRRMERFRVPTAVGATVVLLGIIAAFGAGGFLLSGPIQRWKAEAPQRLEAAERKFEKLRQPLQQVSALASAVDHAKQGATTAPSREVTPGPVPASPGFDDQVLGAAQEFVTELVEVLILLYLLLASGDLFFQKLIKVIPLWRDKAAAARVVEESQGAVMRYMLVNLFINTGQGVVVGLVMWWLGMPGPLLWALFTVLLEFIPYLGATVMVVLLGVIAFATFDHMGHILAVPGSYLVITTIQNNVVSPFLYGQHLKLNPVAVLIGVLFWWFLWGVPGAFLAVPIVATIKIIADHVENLKPVGEFLGE